MKTKKKKFHYIGMKFLINVLAKLFSSNDGKGQDWSDKMVQSLLSRPGIGNRCMNPGVYSIR